MNMELKILAREIRARYKNQISQILFFGSQARGDATPESDYDCLLIFKSIPEALKRDLDCFTNELLLNRGIVFSWTAITESDLERLRYEPFIQNARLEGIAA